jgi:predicted thioesterase
MPALRELRAGDVGEAHLLVDASHTAQAQRSGNVPVLATPVMIALMEEAAVNAIAAALPPGKTSVGTHVDVRHMAATPAGVAIRAQARVTLVDGKRITFRVLAWDALEQIGEGNHERMLVDEEKFLSRTALKAARAAE